MKRITTRISFLQKHKSDISECVQHFDLIVDDDVSVEYVGEQIVELHRRLTEEDHGEKYKKNGLVPSFLLDMVCEEKGWQRAEIDYGLRIAFDVSDPERFELIDEPQDDEDL